MAWYAHTGVDVSYSSSYKKLDVFCGHPRLFFLLLAIWALDQTLEMGLISKVSGQALDRGTRGQQTCPPAPNCRCF